jgi:hypothetical protein
MLPTKKWQSSNGPQSNLQFNVFVGTTAIRRTPVRRTPVCRTFENRHFAERQVDYRHFVEQFFRRTILSNYFFCQIPAIPKKILDPTFLLQAYF